ncbi:uncharacterized protein PAC_19403 [Phialocephala subalpina]|uniref:Heterokaryon incompatibility domain-containing protein n=1 Tax=Phialocephala subalpina TaxID=576137 RepID=A0A1L7XWT5_9HELO|nr:uncharacterized protein PAC_19403 [Phialocephala subalpina]
MPGSARLPGYGSNLCGSCLSIFDHEPVVVFGSGPRDEAGHKILHRSWSTLQKSVDARCYICTTIVNCEDIPYHKGGVLRTSEESEDLNIVFGLYAQNGVIRLVINCGPKSNRRNILFDILGVSDRNGLLDLGFAATRQTSMGHDSVTELAKKWLQNCTESHKDCPNRVIPANYPSRLLDVSGEMIRLIDCDKERPTSPYATMSYCWGRKPFTVLNAENQAIFRAGLLVTELPQSFQDIILTVRRLGLQYIWIDCFCILQGESPEAKADWQREAVKMKLVYTNSYINIGATHARNPTEGCFLSPSRLQNTKLLTPCIIIWQPSSTPARALYRVYSVVQGDWGWDTYTEIQDSNFERNPLFSRGWIYQERLLCRRMLHFAHDQVYWECQEVPIASESCPDGVPSEGRYRRPPLPPFSASDGTHSRLDVWLNILESYTALAITFPEKDKLRAIGGVAERFVESTGMKYGGGMMQVYSPSFLVAQLCWSVSSGRRSSDVWRAPSWNWASMDGGLKFVYGTSNNIPLVSPIEVVMHPIRDDDAFGPLIAGWMSVKGRLLEAPVGFMEDEECPRALRRLRESEDFDTYLVGELDDQSQSFQDNKSNGVTPKVALLPLQMDGSGLFSGWAEQRLDAQTSSRLLRASEYIRLVMSSESDIIGYQLRYLRHMYGLILKRASDSTFVGITRDTYYM